MNKLLKGSIAGAAGIALLLGGAGTFALWNDSAAVTSSNVQSGTMRITADNSTGNAGVWTDASSTVLNGTTVNPDTQKMVPGDKWKLTKTIKVAANGKNLLADLTYDGVSIPTANIPAAELGYTFTATPVAATPATPLVTASVVTVTPAVANTVRIKPGVNGGDTDFVVTFTIEYKDITTTSTGTPPVTGNVLTGQQQSIDLSGFKVKLTQVRP